MDETPIKIKMLREYNNNYYHKTRKNKNIVIECECGKHIKKESLKTHLKTPRHLLYCLQVNK